jgi:hypothetical protein
VNSQTALPNRRERRAGVDGKGQVDDAVETGGREVVTHRRYTVVGTQSLAGVRTVEQQLDELKALVGGPRDRLPERHLQSEREPDVQVESVRTAVVRRHDRTERGRQNSGCGSAATAGASRRVRRTGA